MPTPQRRFQITAANLALISAAHTAIANQWMADPQFKNLPKVAKAYGKSGWYQGSLFFLITSLLNYRWSRVNPTGLIDPVDKAIAALNVLLLWASAVWYTKNGIRDTSAAVGITGLVQAWAAFW